MNDDDADRERDAEISRWLRDWTAPEPPPGLRGRVLSSYHLTKGRPAWRRLWAVQLSVPLPVALAALVLFLAIGALGWPGSWHSAQAVTAGAVTAPTDGLAAFRPLPEIQIRVARRDR